MIKKLNSMPDYQARMPRQPHDLSASFGMSFSTGMITSPYHTMLHTGDKVYFSGNISCRFNPLVLPFLGHIDIHMDYFFVPLSVIYTPAPSLFYQTDDLISATFDRAELCKDHFPLLSVDEALTQIHDFGFGNSGQTSDDFLGEPVDFSMSDGVHDYLPVHAFDCVGKQTVRMCDWFNINPVSLFGTQLDKNGSFTPWYLAAYQACYQLYPGYRNFDREKKDYCYNLDKYYYYQGSHASNTDLNNLFIMRYIDLDKDYFNAIKVSPISGSFSLLTNDNAPSNFLSDRLLAVNNYLDTGTATTSNDSRALTHYPNTATEVSSSPVNGYGYKISTQQIRVMFAFEKMMRVIGRAEKNYESQFLAHFGVKIPHDVMHNITHIGHDVCTLSPKPIISTANTYNSSTGQGSALGEYGGNGEIRFAGKKRSFSAPTHGVFICMMYAKPDFYYQTVISKMNDLSSPMKFWQPEYDRLGMQPLYKWEAAGSFGQSGVDVTDRLGWQFGYEHFKRKYNRISFAFRNPVENRPPTVTSVNQYAPWFLSKIPYCSVEGNWLSANNPAAGDVGTINWKNFKSSPTDLNGVMYMKYSTEWIENLEFQNIHTLFYTDPLIADFHMDMKDVNFMSEYSEPEL